MDIIQRAAELGKAIAESEENLAFTNAQDLVNNDEVAMGLVNKYGEARDKLHALMQNREGNQKELKTMSGVIERINEEIGNNPLLQDMLSAQEKLQSLMRNVDRVINFQITGMSGNDSGCGSGGCEGCKGCS